MPGFLGRVDIQSLGTCSVDSLTMKESKELEEPLTGGGEPEQYVGELLCLGPLGQRVLMPRGPREADSHFEESKVLPPALKCCSSSVRCKFQACLIPKEKG